MKLETISREERLSWLAGIFDGEGSFEAGWTTQFSQKKKVPGKSLYVRIKVSNTDPLMIKRISEICKENQIGFYFRTYRRKDRERWMIEINVRGKGNVKKLLNVVFPYLITKKSQASKLLELIAYREQLIHNPFGKKIRVQSENDKHHFIDNPAWDYLYKNPILNKLIKELRGLKRLTYQPSETKRRANYVLQIKDLDY